MRYFQEIQTVRVPPILVAKAASFANQVTPTVGTPGQGYADSHQQRQDKITFDHLISKVGEEAVRMVFKQMGRQVLGPDYQVYQCMQKSWDADLYIDSVGLAVKTQSSSAAQKFGLSWTFQAGASRYDPILNRPEAWVCFVECNQTNYECYVYPPLQIKTLSFQLPKLDRLKTSKRVVYAHSFAEAGLIGNRDQCAL